MSFLQFLIKKGIIDEKKASAISYEAKSSGKKEEDILLEKGIVSESFLFQLKSEFLKIPLKKVIPEEVSPEILDLIPQDAAKYYQMIPLSKKDNFLEVGMVNPEDLRAQEALKFLARQEGFKYKIYLITPETFQKLLKQYRTFRREVKKALSELEEELRIEQKATPLKREEFEKMAEEAPITKVVAVILRHAVEGKASDIHIEPTRKELKIRFRLDGVLHSSLFLPLRIHPAIITRIKILANLKIDETRIPQDGRFTTKIDERYVDFRVSTFPTTLGEKVVLRVLDPEEGMKKFEELGLEGRNFKVLKKAVKKPNGLILATGPTGSGKTTTLYAILNLLNTEGVNIVTLEDPVEYFIEGVNQSQIRPEIGYTFASGLRHILRQDPDIIMVGEIRDEETAALGIHAALTGHLVLSTLHTNDAIGAIPRLVDLGIPSYLLPPSLNTVIAQRLVRTLCPYCKERILPNPKIKKIILDEINSLPSSIKEKITLPKKFYIYRPIGCKRCKNQGYKGRVALFEILEMTPQLADIILKEISESKIKQEALRQGMITMRQDGILKVLDGVTSIEEVLRVTEKNW